MKLSEKIVLDYKKKEFNKRFKTFEKYWNVIPKLFSLIKTEIADLFGEDFKEYLFKPVKRWFSSSKDNMYVVAKYDDLLFRQIYRFNDYGDGNKLGNSGSLEMRKYCRSCKAQISWTYVYSIYTIGKELFQARCQDCETKKWDKIKERQRKKELKENAAKV